MSLNYARSQPIDKQGNVFPTVPLGTTTQAVAGVPIASSVITFSDQSTVVDVTVIGGAAGNALVIGKWGTASVTASNFDWCVNSGQSRTLVIPVSVMGTSSISGANVANGLYPAMAVKAGTAVSASIFSAEY